MKNKRFISIVVAMAMIISMFTVMAFAASSDISVGGSRNSTSGDAWASCYASGTTATMVVASVYKNGSRVKYLTGSGTNYGYTDFSGVSNDSMQVSSSAKTNGTYYTGPSKWY